MDDLLKTIELRRSEIVEDIRDLVELESPTFDKRCCDVAGRWLADKFERYADARIEWFPQTNQGDHFRANIGSGTKKILILGHFDTVWQVGTLESMPCVVSGDHMSGPGVYDMKAGDVKGLWAFKLLKEVGIPSGRRFSFLATSDEEIGSPTSRALIEEEARSADCVLVLEPSLGYEGGAKLWRKGVGRYDLDIDGVASHAGAKPEEGASATLELAHQILSVADLADEAKGTTVNVGRIAGGTESNVVADHASAEVDIRVMSGDEAERVDRGIRLLQAKVRGTTVRVTGGINRPPMEATDASRRLYQIAARIAARYGIQLTHGGSGGASDGNFTGAIGVPTLDGLGAVGAGAHALGEHIVLSDLSKRFAWFTRFLLEV